MKRLGIDIGSTTVKVAVIDEQHNILFSDYQRHFAKIQETLSSLLKKAKDQIGEMTFAPTVTGSGGLSISSYLDIPFCQEVVCVSSALQDYAPQTDVAIELGGEDAKIIYELGATTIRLAHYQHDQHFYDMCDELGFVLWAEIPYISVHMPNGRENTISQMKELVVQNYNHASIFFWGLSNEITMKGAKDPDLLENHRILNDMVHEMAKTRLTTMAVISMCDISESQYIEIPDLVSYNQYLGWYGGKIEENGPFMDSFHEMYPNIPIGMSEYGAEAYKWHSSHPEQGDYSEEYQAHYHEELIKQLYTRDFVWATHVWNMFDFAADARDEGGCKGMNNKGLVTFDRKYKKDSFYAYKAWLSDEPFVHLCSKNYVERDEDVTTVKVYSNLPEVELFVNGESVGKQTAEDHFFTFEVKNVGSPSCILYCRRLPSISSLFQLVTVSAPISSKRSKGAFLTLLNTSL